MASVRDQSFFNVLFKAVEQFYRAPEQSFATVAWQGRAYFVYKKTALKIFRNLVPAFRTQQYKDDDSLVRYLYERKNADYNLIKLTRQGEENILTNEAHDEFEKIALKEPSEHEQALEMWTDKHTHEETLSQTTQEVTEEKDDDRKKKGLWQMLRGKSGGFNLNIPTKWLKNIAQKGWQVAKSTGRWVIQNAVKPLLRWAGQNIVDLLPKLGNSAMDTISTLNKIKELGPLAVATASYIFIFIALGIVAFIVMTILAFFADKNPLNNPPASSKIDYRISIRDTSIAVKPNRIEDIKNIIKISWPKAKLDYWDHIVERSKNEGWNPAFVLALWIEETGASERTVERMGGSGVPNEKGEFALGHLGCAPTQDQTVDESLNCLNNFLNLHFPNNSYTDDQFFKFMLTYSEGPEGIDFIKNPKFPLGIKIWYLALIPEGQDGAPKPIDQGEQLGISGCPTVGIITNPYGYNILGNPYSDTVNCDGPDNKLLNSCHNGIDIAPINMKKEDNIPVISPISGTIISDFRKDNENGWYLEIKNNSTRVTVTLAHLKNFGPNIDQNHLDVKRGDIVGYVGRTGIATGLHLHYRINQQGSIGISNTILNPYNFLGSSAKNIDGSDILKSNTILQNNYQGTTHTNTNYWGECINSP